MIIQPFRIVVNPNQSKAVQEILFKNGYTWGDGTTTLGSFSYSCLYFFNEDGHTILRHSSYPELDTFFTRLPILSFNRFMEKYNLKEQRMQKLIKLYDAGN